jgi:Tfp pilus assembly protein PilN
MSNASFLPDDYLDQRAERRTNVISLILFVIVMLGVFMAFLFTNQKWNAVKADQMAINTRYQQAAAQIQELVELEEQKGEMLQKAELAAALVERVPRSILLAELINRMPERLSLLEFELSSEKLKPVMERPDDPHKGRLRPTRAKTKQDAEKEVKKVRPPRYKVSIALIGVAPTGQEVSRFLAELNAYALLQEVTLEYTEEKEVEGQVMQKFKINMSLDPTADVREIDPLIVPRSVDDPMTDQLRIKAPGAPGGSVRADGPFGGQGE